MWYLVSTVISPCKTMIHFYVSINLKHKLLAATWTIQQRKNRWKSVLLPREKKSIVSFQKDLEQSLPKQWVVHQWDCVQLDSKSCLSSASTCFSHVKTFPPLCFLLTVFFIVASICLTFYDMLQRTKSILFICCLFYDLLFASVSHGRGAFVMRR